MDQGTETLVAALRPMLKKHIRETRELLAFMTELDKRLTQSQEAERGTAEDKQRLAA